MCMLAGNKTATYLCSETNIYVHVCWARNRSMFATEQQYMYIITIKLMDPRQEPLTNVTIFFVLFFKIGNSKFHETRREYTK